MSDENGAVIDTAPAADAATPSPVEGAASADASQARDVNDNPIPRARAEEMWQRREAKLRQEWEAKYQDAERRANAATEHWQKFAHQTGRSLGFVQDETPEQQFQKQLDERFQKHTQTLEARLEADRQAVREERLRGEWSSGWKGVQTKHADYADIPGFDLAVMKKWSDDTSKDVAQIADEVAAAYEKKLAARANKYAEEKRLASLTKPVRSGGGVGTPAAKDQKGPMSKRLEAVIRGSRGE